MWLIFSFWYHLPSFLSQIRPPTPKKAISVPTTRISEISQPCWTSSSDLQECPPPPSVPYAASWSQCRERKLQPFHFMTFMLWLKDLKQPSPIRGGWCFWKPSLHVHKMWSKRSYSYDSWLTPSALFQLWDHRGLGQGLGSEVRVTVDFP